MNSQKLHLHARRLKVLVQFLQSLCSETHQAVFLYFDTNKNRAGSKVRRLTARPVRKRVRLKLKMLPVD
jgi:hypothetical protein